MNTTTQATSAADARAIALTPGEVVLDEFVEARGPWSAVVSAGDVLTIVDLEGNQAVDCLLYAAGDTTVRYSAAVTIASQQSIAIGSRAWVAASKMPSATAEPFMSSCMPFM